MPDKAKAENPLILDDLYAAFGAADNIVLKKYVANLSSAPCIEMSEELKKLDVGTNVFLYRISKIVYDKNESIQDKLTTVYSTVFSLKNSGLVMLLEGKVDGVDLFLGVVTRNLMAQYDADQLTVLSGDNPTGEVLKNAILGNFPGSELIPVNNKRLDAESAKKVKHKSDTLGKSDIITEALGSAKFISSVSSIPALRSTNQFRNLEFTQGLEKFVDAMRGKKYTALIIADAMDSSKIEEMCAEYEDLYSQLAPFKASSQTISAQSSTTDTESLIKGITDTTNETVAKSLTHGTAESKTNTNSVGASVQAGFKIFGKGVDVSANYNHAWSKTHTDTNAETNTKSTGTAKSLSSQNSVAKALSRTDGESIQINYENRAVKTLMDRIDEQIKRMRSCEDFGMFDTCAYFTADDEGTVIAASSTFKSITRGENSSIESSSVNLWTQDDEVEKIKDYLMRFYHPEFISSEFVLKEYVTEKEDNGKRTFEIDQEHQPRTTAAMLVSGKEMAFQMPLPKKTVPGVAVIECAEFGREVVSLSDNVQDLPLGCIYHMRSEEKTEVKLCSQNLTAHTFITGSTGAGKSTTVYKILDEATKISSNGENEVHFLVVEPAKGEYKNALGSNKKFGLHVYGTNPNLTKLLRINPFKFPNGKIHIYEHLDRLTEIFNVCWPMYAAMPAVLKAAMENAYRSAGWNLIKSENEHGDVFPSFVDVALEVEKYINKSEYSEENKSNYKGSLLTRLESLTNGINSMIFSSDDIDDKDLFDENVVVDLSRVGSTETKALIMGILVLKLQEYRIAQSNGSNNKLQHITVLEEAHNLLKRTSTEQSSESSNLLGKSVEMLANSIAEMRTYGEGFIIADQSPGLLDLSVIRNTNTKIIMRLPDYSDRELVGKAAGLNDEQIIELSKLPQGVAAVYQNEWITPVLCSVKKPNWLEDEKPFLEKDNPHTRADNTVVFDFLDTNWRKRLDTVEDTNALKKLILKGSIPTANKIKLLDYLNNPKTQKGTKQLAAILFDYFENAKNVLEESANLESIEEMKMAIIAELQPSAIQCNDEQLDCLITLLIKEYIDRYFVDYPIWREFTLHCGRETTI